MYANPVLFPETSNREDLLCTVQLFDDDTGSPIDVSGRKLAAAGDFASAAWTVTSGTTVTASVTPLVIKDYPFGNEMQAISPIVGKNLGILAGDPVTIADATGLNTMTGYVTSYAPATGALVAQIGSSFAFEIREQGHDSGWNSGYGASAYIGTDDTIAPIIKASLGNMLTVVDIGRVQIRIPAGIMQQLRHKTYGAAMTMFDGYDSRQLFIGKLPILRGGVTLQPVATPSVSNPYGLP